MCVCARVQYSTIRRHPRTAYAHASNQIKSLYLGFQFERDEAKRILDAASFDIEMINFEFVRFRSMGTILRRAAEEFPGSHPEVSSPSAL